MSELTRLRYLKAVRFPNGQLGVALSQFEETPVAADTVGVLYIDDETNVSLLPVRSLKLAAAALPKDWSHPPE